MCESEHKTVQGKYILIGAPQFQTDYSKIDLHYVSADNSGAWCKPNPYLSLSV